MRSCYRPAYRNRARAGLRPWARTRHRAAATLLPGHRFWSRPPNQVRLLCSLVKKILKFHENEPLLSSDPMHAQNHTDFGHFRSDLHPPQNHTDSGHFCADSKCRPDNDAPVPADQASHSQLPAPDSPGEGGSALRPRSLWARQPNEPAADYQLFTDWLRLPAPRRFTQCAATLGRTLSRLRRVAARHRWKTRATAFDNYRANASSRALDQLLQQESHDAKTRASQFREQEWALHEEILRAASVAARAIHQHPRRVSLQDIARLFNLASVLGRRATGLPLDPADQEPEPPRLTPEFEEALMRAYGPKTDHPQPLSAHGPTSC